MSPIFMTRSFNLGRLFFRYHHWSEKPASGDLSLSWSKCDPTLLFLLEMNLYVLSVTLAVYKSGVEVLYRRL